MKILNLKDFLPLAVSTVAIVPGFYNQTFKYSDFDQKDIQIMDEYTQNHLNSTLETSYTDLLVKVKFKNHLEKWKLKTRFLSSPNKIVENKDFQEIIKIGEPVVKFIVEELDEEPSYLVWALNIIYGFKISDDPSTTIPEASKKWIRYLTA